MKIKLDLTHLKGFFCLFFNICRDENLVKMRKCYILGRGPENQSTDTSSWCVQGEVRATKEAHEQCINISTNYFLNV
jgi:hypothetical protein